MPGFYVPNNNFVDIKQSQKKQCSNNNSIIKKENSFDFNRAVSLLSKNEDSKYNQQIFSKNNELIYTQEVKNNLKENNINETYIKNSISKKRITAEAINTKHVMLINASIKKKITSFGIKKHSQKDYNVLFILGLISFLCIGPILIGFILALIPATQIVGFAIILGFAMLGIILAFISIIGSYIKRDYDKSKGATNDNSFVARFFGWVGLILSALSLFVAGTIKGFDEWAGVKKQ